MRLRLRAPWETGQWPLSREGARENIGRRKYYVKLSGKTTTINRSGNIGPLVDVIADANTRLGETKQEGAGCYVIIVEVELRSMDSGECYKFGGRAWIRERGGETEAGELTKETAQCMRTVSGLYVGHEFSNENCTNEGMRTHNITSRSDHHFI